MQETNEICTKKKKYIPEVEIEERGRGAEGPGDRMSVVAADAPGKVITTKSGLAHFVLQQATATSYKAHAPDAHHYHPFSSFSTMPTLSISATPQASQSLGSALLTT
jgi:hypothetical protein